MRGVTAVLLLASWGFAASAGAQDTAEEVNARRLHEAGRVAFEAGRYGDALIYFEQAYELSPRPRLLYNIGISADRLGRRERALEALEQYLASEPEAANRAEVETRVAVLRRGPDDADPDPHPEPDPTEPSPGDPTAGTVALVAGGALAVGGLVTTIIGAADYASLSNIPDATTWPSIRDQHDRAPILVAVGAIVGGLGLAGVTVGIVLLSSGGSSARVAVSAQGVEIEGSF